MPTLTRRRIDIDRVRCDGHGVCHALLPDRVSLDEWGFPILSPADIPDDEVADVRRTVAACPALALRLTTDQPR
jgi:ferredoxin